MSGPQWPETKRLGLGSQSGSPVAHRWLGMMVRLLVTQDGVEATTMLAKRRPAGRTAVAERVPGSTVATQGGDGAVVTRSPRDVAWRRGRQAAPVFAYARCDYDPALVVAAYRGGA